MEFIEPNSSTFVAITGLSYEQAFTELETIVAALEADDHSLEKALDLFERGQALAKHCASLLDLAEQKVLQISGGDLTPFGNIEK